MIQVINIAFMVFCRLLQRYDIGKITLQNSTQCIILRSVVNSRTHLVFDTLESLFGQCFSSMRLADRIVSIDTNSRAGIPLKSCHFVCIILTVAEHLSTYKGGSGISE